MQGPHHENAYGVNRSSCGSRYNELQLYVEHTFSFRDHEIVWKNASPLTGENIREIDQYCRERFIELVPNLNSFGHFERWLRHEPYKAMAECPDGFRREDPYMVRDHGTTLRPDADSLAFVDSLYTEYLPNFTSGKFNVGMDEPWELGQGWSKEDVSRKGKDKVYLEHLEGIRKLVEKHGKRMQFWADVLLEKPENASLLSPTAEPIIWGYEADHPFGVQSEVVASCGLNFRLAPGTGTWRSFTGRWPDARANLESASENALKHGAEGILLTTWGDCGNHQPWCTLYPSLLYSAQLAWNGTRLDDPPPADAINRMVFRSSHMNLGAAIMEAGRLDQQIGSRLPNRSLAWNLLFEERRDEVRRHLEKNQTARRMGDGIDFLSRIVEELSGRNSNHKESLAAEELLLGIELSSIALNKGLALLSGNPQQDPHDTPQILRKYEKAWLARARPGGLEESLSLLEGSSVSVLTGCNSGISTATASHRILPSVVSLEATASLFSMPASSSSAKNLLISPNSPSSTPNRRATSTKLIPSFILRPKIMASMARSRGPIGVHSS